MNNISGVINIYKEKGYTSHDVVNIVRKNLNRVKTGHTGTLDPDATGVLPICLGRATKLAEYIASKDKSYKAVVKLGATTTTQDASGEILTKAPISSLKEEIEKVVYSFKGTIYQKPPMYSAVKVNGERLYNIARQGREIERKERKIQIYEINILNFIDSETFEIDVTCSKGTYIRTLCSDIGEKLGCGAYMQSLLRTKSGKFELKDSITLENFIEYTKSDLIHEFIIPLEELLNEYKKAIVLKDANKFLYNGNKINLNYIKNWKDLKQNEKVAIYDEERNLVGIYQVLDSYIKPLTMLLRGVK